MPKYPKVLVLLIILLFLWVLPSFAITLLMKEEALSRLFPDADEIVNETIVASEEKIIAVKQALGGKLTHILKGKETEELNQQKEFTFYFAKKENKVIGTALIIDEPGKWGPIKFIVRLSPEGKIEATAVMAYKETRGRPIAAQSFLSQFIGKTLNDSLVLHKDIQGISGATVSSEAACFVMKKAMLLYKELVQK